MIRTVCVLTIALLQAGCGPRLAGELIAGRTVMLTNGGDTSLKIERIIANDQTGRAECVEQPDVELAPGRSHTTTFFYCDEVREVDVETDQGWREVGFD